MTSRTDEGEIVSLTSVRGLAAFWVVVFHFAPVIDRILPEASFLKPLISVGYFAVPLFFVLSGYVLGLRYLAKLRRPTISSTLRFLWLRLGRIYPVHLITLLAVLAIAVRRGWPTASDHTVGSFISNLCLTHAWQRQVGTGWNYPSWSLSSEWFMYLLFPLLAVLLGGMGRRSAALLTAVACAVSVAVSTSESVLPYPGLAVVVPTFVGGIGLAVLCPPGELRYGRFVIDVGLLAVVVLPYLIAPGATLTAAYLLLFFALVAAMGATGRRSGALLRSRPLIFLGNISYSLYMTHAILAMLIARMFPYRILDGLSVAVRVLLIFGCLLLMLLAAIGLHYVVERPLRIASRRLVSAPKATIH